MAIHVPIVVGNHYFGRHEDNRVPGIPGPWTFGSAGQTVGVCDLRRIGPALLSRQCRLSNTPAPVRTHAEYGASCLLAGQLAAHRAVRLVLSHDQRTI